MCMFVCECMYLCMCRQWVRKWRQLSRFLMSHLINLRQSLTNLQLGRSLAMILLFLLSAMLGL